jgi:diguanylate cyclase (GGDEF)-like protein
MDGDEFAVILPEVGEEGAMAVADRIFKSITGSPSPVAAMREKDEKIRLCVGVACCNETLKDYQILMKLADESLYHAKTRGRNRVGDLVPVEHLDAPYYARPSNLSEVSTFYPTGG